MAVKIFVVGATGYQGSTLVHNLLAHGDKYDITILARSESSAAPYKEKGCKAIIGSFEDDRVLKQGSADADVVFSVASADDLAPVQAMVEALKPKGVTQHACFCTLTTAPMWHSLLQRCIHGNT